MFPVIRPAEADVGIRGRRGGTLPVRGRRQSMADCRHCRPIKDVFLVNAGIAGTIRDAPFFLITAAHIRRSCHYPIRE